MKVGEKVRLLPELGGMRGVVEAYFSSDNVHVRMEKPIKHSNEKGETWETPLARYHSWQLRSDYAPEIALEVSRLQWAWGDEQMWVCPKAEDCGSSRACPHGDNHEHIERCDSPRFCPSCVPVCETPPSPWRKARIRWPNQSMVFSPGTVWPVEIQMEGE